MREETKSALSNHDSLHNDANGYSGSSAISDASLTEEVELPQPFLEENANTNQHQRMPRRMSIFESCNDDGAFPDIDSHENPLVMKQSRLERKAREAHEDDERDALETFTNREYWSKIQKKTWDWLRPDFILNHLDLRSIKIVSRTWLSVFVSTILIVINPVNRFMGQASYLLLICTVIEVSGGISIAHAFYTGIIDMLFALFAFTFSVVSHSISWRIRGYPEISDLMSELAKEGICEIGDANCFQHEIHLGRYLNTKVTVVSLIGIVFSLTICGYLQTLNKALTPAWVFALICTIVTGVYLTITPIFGPWTYGALVIIPLGFSLSLRFVLSVIWFPVTSNFKFLNVVIDVMDSTNSILNEDIDQLKKESPASPKYSELMEKLQTRINGTLDRYALLKLEGLLVRGEIAFSRLDAGNLGEFRSLTRMLLTSMAGLRFFFSQIVEKRELILGHSDNHMDSVNRKGNAPQDSGVEISSEANASHAHQSTQSRNRAASGSSTSTKAPASSDSSDASKDEPPHRPSSTHNDNQTYNDKDHGWASNCTKERHMTLPRSETFSGIQRPTWGVNNKWLKKKLSKGYVHAGNFEENRFILAEEMDWDGMRMGDLEILTQNIVSHYKETSDAIKELVAEVGSWAKEANSFRFFSLFSPKSMKQHRIKQKQHSERLKRALAELEQKLSNEKNRDYVQWVQTYSKPGALRSRQHYIYALTLDAFYGCTVERVATCIRHLATYCILIDNHRPSAVFVHPFMKSLSRSPRFEDEYNTDDVTYSSDSQISSPLKYSPVSRVQPRSPDTSPPRTVFHLLGIQVEKLWNFCTDDTVIFCLKRAVVTMSTTIVFVTRSSIFFSYGQRTIWASIMTGLTVSQQAVDGVYGFLIKLIFTVIGSVAGMVIWYIGDGHGLGNPYGFTAAVGFIMAIFLYYRHFHRLAIPMGAVVLCVTTVLVSGMSWNSTHLPTVDSLIGHGFSVAWKRFVLVTVGLTVAFIGTILPHPITGKKKVRLILGHNFRELGDIQAGISEFMSQRAADCNVHISVRTDPIIQKLRGVKASIGSAQHLVSLINYEPPLGGIWPKNRYTLLMKLTREMVFLLEDTYYLADSIENTNDMQIIIQRAGWSSIELTSSLYAVIMLGSWALSTGEPLPSVTPGHLSEMYSRKLRKFLEFDASRSETGLEGLLEERYVSRDGRTALALISTVSAFYKRMDICLLLIKGLVGEIYSIDQHILSEDLEKAPLMWSNAGAHVVDN